MAGRELPAILAKSARSTERRLSSATSRCHRICAHFDRHPQAERMDVGEAEIVNEWRVVNVCVEVNDVQRVFVFVRLDDGVGDGMVATEHSRSSQPLTWPQARSSDSATGATAAWSSASSWITSRPTCRPTSRSTSSWTTTRPTRRRRSATGLPGVRAGMFTSPRRLPRGSTKSFEFQVGSKTDESPPKQVVREALCNLSHRPVESSLFSVSVECGPDL